jgi:hypothetical protein
LKVIKFIQSWDILLEFEVEVHSIPSSLDVLDLFLNLLLFLGNIDDFVDLVLEVVQLKIDDIFEGCGWGGDVDLFSGQSEDLGPMSGLHGWVQEVTDEWKEGLHLLDFLHKLFVLESTFDNFLWHSLDLNTEILVDLSKGINWNLLPWELLPIVVVVGHQ